MLSRAIRLIFGVWMMRLSLTRGFSSLLRQQQSFLGRRRHRYQRQNDGAHSNNVVFNGISVSGSATSFDEPLMAPRKRTTSTSSMTKERPYKLLIVESPAKTKTMKKILDNYVKEKSLNYDFHVTWSMGHVRNLPRTAPPEEQQQQDDLLLPPILGIDVNRGYKPFYEIIPGKETLVRELVSLANGAQQVLFATDQDREGEAVAWHLSELLPSHVPQSRVAFTEITPQAIAHAVEHARDIDLKLVEAQETRRVLDRIAGFSMSPLLWKKISPGLSAGRVQSVGMALVVQRERLRLAHVPVDYFSLDAIFDEGVTAYLTKVNGTTICNGQDFDNDGNIKDSSKLHLTQNVANNLCQVIMDDVDSSSPPEWTIVKVTSTERTQKAPLPLSTSKLQQAAVNTLGMSVKSCMSMAQTLYEAGLISYIRTDNCEMSEDAHKAAQETITDKFGSSHVAPKKKVTSKQKAAQEAHEAIRPTVQPNGAFLDPDQVDLPDNQKRFYKLIYDSTLASRMPPKVTRSTKFEIEGVCGDTILTFEAKGSVVVRPGFSLALGKSHQEDVVLPDWKEGQILDCHDLESVSHTTLPPSRYSEASFVKELESLGVGRPSTYASTLQTLRDRAYVGTPVKGDSVVRNSGKNKRSNTKIVAQRAAGGQDFTGDGRGPLVPSLSAFVVCSLLENHCPSYIEAEFTALMEDQLDEIARGDEGADRVAYLDQFYGGKDGLAHKIKVMDETIDPDVARRADLPILKDDKYNDVAVMIGPWGPYVANTTTMIQKNNNEVEKPKTAQLPPGLASDLSLITPQVLSTLLEVRDKDGALLGIHPDDGREIRLKVGRFGAYLQWGSTGEPDTTNHSLPHHFRRMAKLSLENNNNDAATLKDMMGLSLEEAVGYVGLPRKVCELDGEDILASIGPYGPYLKYQNKYVSLKASEGDVLTVGEDVAKQIVKEGIIDGKRSPRGTIAELGERDGKMVTVCLGQFGKYLKWGKVNAKMPPEFLEQPEQLPLDMAWKLIQEKQQQQGGGRRKKSGKQQQEEDDDGGSGIELPPAPKKPKGSYLLFCDDKRPELQGKFTSVAAMSKELGKLWAESKNDADTVRHYQELAEREKQVYLEEKKKWQTECQALLQKSVVGLTTIAKTTTGSGGKLMALQKMVDSAAPKRPKSAYQYFCAEKRGEVSKTISKLGEVTKELARQWKETKDTEERLPFEELAEADKLRYAREMDEYNKNKEAAKRTEAAETGTTRTRATVKRTPTTKKKKTVSKKSKSGGTKKAKGSSTPKKKRGRSAYMIFCSQHRSSIVDSNGEKLPLGETTKRLAKMWKECDDETRLPFQQMAEEEKKANELL